jgi:hypothetical protein
MDVMKPFLILGLLGVASACSPGGGGADGGSDAAQKGDTGAPDAATDAAADTAADAPASDAGGDSAAVDAGACQAQVDAVIDGGCTRCWPAARAMCTDGNAAALEGMLACLTGGKCWSEFDYNTAGPCMDNVISQYGDANTTAVHGSATALGCNDWQVRGITAIATELSNVDRAAFATCIAALSTCTFDSCIAATHWNPALCQN